MESLIGVRMFPELQTILPELRETFPALRNETVNGHASQRKGTLWSLSKNNCKQSVRIHRLSNKCNDSASFNRSNAVQIVSFLVVCIPLYVLLLSFGGATAVENWSIDRESTNSVGSRQWSPPDHTQRTQQKSTKQCPRPNRLIESNAWGVLICNCSSGYKKHGVIGKFRRWVRNPRP